MLIEFIILLGLALFIFYKWSTSTFDFFEKIGIPYDKPFPLFGSQKDIVLRKSSMYDNVNRLYKQFNTSIAGVFDQRNPTFIIRDPEVLKQITIKDFDHFVNHRQVFSVEDDELFGNALSNLHNEKWKAMRSTLSPVFTGSKMRQMFVLINEVAHESMKYLKKDGKAEIDFNIKDYFTHFTNDVIASAVFGLQINSFKDEDNEFYAMGKKVTKFSFWQNMKFLLFTNFKYIMRAFKMSLFSQKYTTYFTRLVLDTMKYRQEHKIVRPDMINMMMEAKGLYIDKEPNEKPSALAREWSDNEIVAQFFVFFFAGFEPTAVLMSFASHELMVNPDVQERLRQEIQDVKENLNGKPLTYEVLQSMKYMDMVVSETLRRWPPAVVTDRQCNKDFHYKDDEIDVTIKVGQHLWIPIVGYHLDERYFSDPLKFDPERFSDENKGSILPFTYLPFGVGPRNCIANRFALMEAKAMLFYLVGEFEIRPSPNSTIPMVLEKGIVNPAPKNGFWSKLVPLKS
ncbi:probable cytochrome P450 9f2 isoform X3 [Eupeodes corollae]|uniref:probable cytochrome P450 9f2 isoform X3 n=1 Tax=Eupeodes corollae TaxID=290404 RepID=UPI00249173A7|nr:probable cytochrome P450 9f2 isoform X3 [Eupeodes corollae]